MKKILIFIAIFLGVIDITIAGLIIASARIKTIKEAEIVKTEKGSKVVLKPMFEESETEKISIKKRIDVILGKVIDISKKDAENVPIDDEWNVDPRFDYVLTIDPYFGKIFKCDVTFDYSNAILLKDHNKEKISRIFTRREIGKPIKTFKIDKGLENLNLYEDRELTKPLVDKVPDIQVIYYLDESVANRNYTITYKYESIDGENIPKEKLGFDNPIRGKAIENQKIPVPKVNISNYTIISQFDSFVVDEVDKQVYVIYKRNSIGNEVKVEFKVNDQIVKSFNIPKNTTISYPTDILPPEGYNITNWMLGGVIFDFNQPINMDITLVAVLEKDHTKFAKVDFEVEGNVVKSIEVLKGKKITKPTDITPPPGKKITGWTLNGIDFTFEELITENIKLVAKLEKDINQYVKVTFKVNETLVEKEFLKGSTVTIPAEVTAPEGYVITGWTLNDIPFDLNTPLTEDITLVAVLESNKCLVTFTVKGEVKKTVIVLKNNLVEEPTDILPPEGYFLRGWLLNNHDYSFTTPVTSNITLEAKLERDPEKIVLVEFEMQDTIVKILEIPINTKVEEPTDILPPENYIIENWTLDGEPYNFAQIVQHDIKLVANLREDPLKHAVVDFIVDGNIQESILVLKGTKVTIPSTITAPNGYKITGWTLNGSPFNLDTIVTENIQLVAVLEKDPNKYAQVQIKVGEAIVDTYEVLKGDTIEEPTEFTPPFGYIIVGWKVNGEKINFPYVVNNDVTLDAMLEQESEQTFKVNFIINGEIAKFEMVKKNEKVHKPEPTEFTIEPGYTITDWLLNGEHYDFNTLVTQELNLVAKIEKDATKWANVKFIMQANIVKELDVLKGTLLEEPTDILPPPGYIITAWDVDNHLITFPYRITEDVEIEALLEEEVKTYLVRYFVNGDIKKSFRVPEGTILTEPDDITIPVGYIFKGWLFNDMPYTFTVPVTSHIDLYADLERDPNILCWVSFYVQSSPVLTVDVLKNTKVEEPNITPPYGYIIDYWMDKYGQKFDFDTIIYKDTKLYAHLEVNKAEFAEVTYITNNLVVKKDVIKKGEAIGIWPVIEMPEGYTFVEWQKDGIAYDFNLPVTEDITLVAKLVLIVGYHTVTFMYNGEIYFMSAVPDNTPVKSPKLEVPGYITFWQKDGVDFDFGTPITEDTILVAKLDPSTFSIEYVLENGVTNSPKNPPFYTIETEDIILEPAKKPGAGFIGWYKDPLFTQEVKVIYKGTMGVITLFPKFGRMIDRLNDTKDIKEIIEILKDPAFGLTINGELPTDEFYSEKVYEDFANNKIYKDLKFGNVDEVNEMFNKLNEVRKLHQEIVDSIVAGNQPTSYLVKFNEKLNQIPDIAEIRYEGDKTFQELINNIENLITEKYNILNVTAKNDSNKFIEKYQKEFGNKLTLDQLNKVFNMALDDLLNNIYRIFLVNFTVDDTRLSYKYGEVIPAKDIDTTRLGYRFKKLITSDTNEEFVINQDPVVRSMKLILRWDAINYSINYVLNGGISTGTNPSSYTIEDYEKLYNLNNPTTPGLDFIAWYLDPEFTNMFSPKNETIFADFGITLYAKFENLAKTFENLKTAEQMKNFIENRKYLITEYNLIKSYDPESLSYLYSFLANDIHTYYSTGHGVVETMDEFNRVIYHYLLAYKYFHTDFIKRYNKAIRENDRDYILNIENYTCPEFWANNNLDFSFRNYFYSLRIKLEKIVGEHQNIVINEFADKVVSMEEAKNPFDLFERLLSLSGTLGHVKKWSSKKHLTFSEINDIEIADANTIKEYLKFFQTPELLEKYEKIYSTNNNYTIANLKDITYLLKFENYNNSSMTYLERLALAIEHYDAIKGALIETINNFNEPYNINTKFYQKLYDEYFKILKKPTDDAWLLDIYVSNLTNGDNLLNIVNFATYQKMNLINQVLVNVDNTQLLAVGVRLLDKRAEMSEHDTKNIDKLLNAYKEVLDELGLGVNFTGLQIINSINYNADFGRDFLIAIQKSDINVSKQALEKYSELSAYDQEKINKYIISNKPISGYDNPAIIKQQFENMVIAAHLIKEFGEKVANNALDDNLLWLKKINDNYPNPAYAYQLEGFSNATYSIASLLTPKKKKIYNNSVYKLNMSYGERLEYIINISRVLDLAESNPIIGGYYTSKFIQMLNKVNRSFAGYDAYYIAFIQRNVAATMYSHLEGPGSNNLFDLDYFTYIFDQYVIIANYSINVMNKISNLTADSPILEDVQYLKDMYFAIYPICTETYLNLKFSEMYSKENFSISLGEFLSQYVPMSLDGRRGFMRYLIKNKPTTIHEAIKFLEEEITRLYELDSLYLLVESLRIGGDFNKFKQYLAGTGLTYSEFERLNIDNQKHVHKMMKDFSYNIYPDVTYESNQHFQTMLKEYSITRYAENQLLNILKTTTNYTDDTIDKIKEFANKVNLQHYKSYDLIKKDEYVNFLLNFYNKYNKMSNKFKAEFLRRASERRHYVNKSLYEYIRAELESILMEEYTLYKISLNSNPEYIYNEIFTNDVFKKIPIMNSEIIDEEMVYQASKIISHYINKGNKFVNFENFINYFTKAYTYAKEEINTYFEFENLDIIGTFRKMLAFYESYKDLVYDMDGHSFEEELNFFRSFIQKRENLTTEAQKLFFDNICYENNEFYAISDSLHDLNDELRYILMSLEVEVKVYDESGENLLETIEKFLGDVISINHPAEKPGYRFKGWVRINSNEFVDLNSIIYGEISIKPFYELIDYKINYYGLEELEFKDTFVKQYNFDKPLFNLPIIERSGYVFVGWYTNPYYEGEKVTVIDPSTFVEGKELDLYVRFRKA